MKTEKENETTRCLSKLRSYKCYNTDSGQIAYVIITHKEITAKELNSTIFKGWNVKAVEERSQLVNKKFVDNGDE